MPCVGFEMKFEGFLSVTKIGECMPIVFIPGFYWDTSTVQFKIIGFWWVTKKLWASGQWHDVFISSLLSVVIMLGYQAGMRKVQITFFLLFKIKEIKI